MFVKYGQIVPKEYPPIAMENLFKENEIPTIVSKLKNNEGAGQNKVFTEIIKYGPEISHQTITKILQLPSARLQNQKYYAKVIVDFYQSLQKMG